MLVNCVGEGASRAQVYLGQSNSSIIGGEYFGAGAVGTKGLIFKDGLAGLNIYTQIRDCTGAAIDFGSGITSSNVVVINYQSTGVPRIGTIPTDSVVSFTSNGVRGYSFHRFHSNLHVLNNLGIGMYVFGSEKYMLGLSNTMAPSINPIEGNFLYSENNAVKLQDSNGQKTLLSRSIKLGEKKATTIDVSNCYLYQIPAETDHNTIINLKSAGQAQEVTLIFSDDKTSVQNNQYIALAGAINFAGNNDDTLTLIYNGSKWIEKARSLN